MISTLGVLICALALTAEEPGQRLDVSAGMAVVGYQTVYSATAGSVLEVAVEGRVRRAFTLGAGTRLWLAAGQPEAFLRAAAAPTFGDWRPALGLELGLTAAPTFGEGDLMLRETRAAMEEGIGPWYVAFHATPLRWRLGRRWLVSVLELTLGTHLAHLGRTSRIQLGLLSVGVSP
jgi:hypothetical protein